MWWQLRAYLVDHAEVRRAPGGGWRRPRAAADDV